MRCRTLTPREIAIIGVIAAAGIGSKSVISPIINIVTDFMLIPGGSTAGGFYMMFLVLAKLFMPKIPSASLTGAMQGFLAFFLGLSSFQGAFVIIVYTLPGVVIDLVISRLGINDIYIVLACGLANLTGSFTTNLIFFKLSGIPFVLWFAMSLLSGILGGFLCIELYWRLKNAVGILERKEIAR
jgi:energy-coupling factor transport system substrate-specific component